MNSHKTKVYLASGWFNDEEKKIRQSLEDTLEAHPQVDLYSPLRDGIKLNADQKNDPDVLRQVFKDNIGNILDANIIVANIYSGAPMNDPGTMYEIGYAMANNIPVVGYTPDLTNIKDRFAGILDGFECIITNTDDLNHYFYEVTGTPESIPTPGNKVLFVGNGNKEVDEKIVSHIMDSGAKVRWVNEVHTEIYTRIDEIFDDIEYMVAVIDDRNTTVSWMMGQAFARGIPIITYTDYNYTVNVMLLVSILTHIKGADDLKEFLQKVQRQGLSSIPKCDISQINAC